MAKTKTTTIDRAEAFIILALMNRYDIEDGRDIVHNVIHKCLKEENEGNKFYHEFTVKASDAKYFDLARLKSVANELGILL